MNPTPKTIQIFLPDGEPSGIRIAELTTRIVQAIAVPRSDLVRFFGRSESQHIGTYFLFGGDDDSTKPIVYIGQTEDLKTRLKQHDADSRKEFWNVAVVLVSRTHSFTQAHIRWLEWTSINRAKDANRFVLNNGNGSSEPFVTEPIRADLEEIFETGSLLLETLGFTLFRSFVPRTAKGDSGTATAEQWFVAGPEARAEARFTEDGFVVLKGGRCRGQFSASARNSGFARKREKMIADGVLRAEGDGFVFVEDCPFRSPSGAAAVILASHINGWNAWKNAAGQTLDEVKRGS